MHFGNTWVNFHQSWYNECTSFTATVHGLEGVVDGRVAHDMRNGVRLNDRWLIVAELG